MQSLARLSLALLLLPTAPAARQAAAAEDPLAAFEHRPPGGQPGEVYTDQLFSGNYKQATGLAFDEVGRMFVWEKSGRVWVPDEDGTKPSQPLVDITEEVGDWGGVGFLGFAPDPNFTVNGHVYLFYVVDYHHLTEFGTPDYDPDQTDDFVDTISRVTRYTVVDPDPALHGHELELDYGSRLVLVGESLETGIPVCTSTHSVGNLAFGTDGSLLVSHGDGYLPNLTEGNCFPDGILAEKENVDQFRAQLRDSLSGKVLRVDPQTGDGLPSNPGYDPLRPRAPVSRVWASGLRQPFRIAVRPLTGGPSHPGSIYIGEVGAQGWEEINVARDGAENFGWPVFEGMDFFSTKKFDNLDAPNPLFGQSIPGEGFCNDEYFIFQDLIAQDSLDPIPDLPNPCDPSVQVPAGLKRVHTRPVIAWAHDVPITLVPTYVGGQAAVEELGVPGTSVQGEAFAGNASIGGVWYDGDDFPPQYKNTYFAADYGEEWIRCFRFDSSDQLVEVLPFTDEAPRIVGLATHPAEGGLYYIRHGGQSTVRKITFTGDPAPTAVATPEVSYGPGPLAVQFDGSASSDLNGPVTFQWDFDDDSPLSTEPSPLHVFASVGGPETYEVTLVVTDDTGQEDEATVLVSVDNTPPSVEILTPAMGQTYASDQPETLPLTALVGDAETPLDVDCVWEVVLVHDNHTHPDPPDDECVAEATVGPHTNPGDIEYYEVHLTVTDAEDLTSTDVHYVLREDDCNLNGFPDADDIAQGISLDTDLDGIPDECAADCDGDGLSDVATVLLMGDCNENGIPDDCEPDFDGDGTPDPCQPFFVDVDSISVGAGGRQDMTLSVGPVNAGALYFVLGSLSGTSPGTPFGPVTLPLVWDPYFTITLTAFNQVPLVDTAGFLDANGEAFPAMDLPTGFPPSLAGLTAHHAAIVLNAAPAGLQDITLVTNAMPLHLLP